MTTSKATSPEESLPIGVPSSPQSNARVIDYEFASARPVPLPNTVSLDSLITEFESEPAMSAHMAEARRDLSAALYADEPDTLSALRLAAGLSQAQLADRAGTSQSHIARIEGGQNDPTTEVVARIAQALNVDEARAFRAIRVQRETRGQAR